MAVGEAAFLTGRVVFAVVVGYLALGNLLDLQASVGYARSKNVPLPGIGVPLGSVGLIFGSVSVAIGLYPTIGVLSIVAILGPITVLMHDFWACSGQERQNERIHFLKNLGLIGAALTFFLIPPTAWPLTLGFAL